MASLLIFAPDNIEIVKVSSLAPMMSTMLPPWCLSSTRERMNVPEDPAEQVQRKSMREATNI